MIRRYTDQPVPPDAVRALLSAAAHAPSPHNRQPWRFAILTGAARHRLAAAMGERLRIDLARDGLAPDAIERDATRSYLRITGAPVSILACMTLRDMDPYSDAGRSNAEAWMAAQAVAAACQNILLCATELGLGACWMCAPLFCPDVVIGALSLPDDWKPQALITVGYPADAGKLRERKHIDEVAVWIDA
jgi:F420 biosynthesis protein FbiB-like protein